MKTLVISTRNRKKVEEIKPLLADLPIQLQTVADFANVPEIVEDGHSFEEHARKKASDVAKQIHQWTLAEDSGLVVAALKGEPGIHSAYYAGEHGNDVANNQKLLQKLSTVPDQQRNAYYVCVAALADPNGQIVAVTEGRCHGRIATEEHGKSGFGYDPLFIVLEYHRTFGELSPLVKQVLSHRSRAISSMKKYLLQYLG